MIKYYKIILWLQCAVIGVRLKSVDYNANRWFMEHSWTKRQAKLFVFLAALYLYLNKKAARAVMASWYRTWPRCVAAAKEWEWNYGWKYKES